MTEEWRDIPDFPNYRISSWGRVYTKPRPRVRGGIKAATPNPQGYLQTGLYRGDGRYRMVKIHILVAEAFHGPKPAHLPHVRHLNDVKTDNRAVNLKYGTPGENARDKVVNGVDPNAMKTHCPHNHEYTPENTRMGRNPNGYAKRICRQCDRDYKARARAASRPTTGPALKAS